MLPKQAIDELKRIIKNDYGQDISIEQAEELGMTLLRLTRVAFSVLSRKHENNKD